LGLSNFRSSFSRFFWESFKIFLKEKEFKKNYACEGSSFRRPLWNFSLSTQPTGFFFIKGVSNPKEFKGRAFSYTNILKDIIFDEDSQK
jgi:hypothetical protein